MRGSGKSAIGRTLAKIADYNFIDTDKQIVEQAGKTIPEIVAQEGWPAFRKLETSICQNLTQFNDTIISTGGGIITSPENIEILKGLGTIVYLEGSPEALAKRIKKSKNRPSLKEGLTLEAELEAVLKERSAIYQSTADITINTDISSNNKEQDLQNKAELILSLVNVKLNSN